MTKYTQIFIILCFIDLVVLSSCDDKKTNESGFLKGTISIGPLCPVERIPPDPACSPTAETYKAYQVDIYSSDGASMVAKLSPSLDGSFITELPAGNYKLNFESGILSIGGSNLPSEIAIKKNDTTLVNINIDTGIR